MSSNESAVIFDLDQTLVDSSPLEALRRSRKWKDVYAKIPELVPYDGICALLEKLRTHGVKLAIVTSSPSTYCSRLLKHCEFVADAVVCYHDTKRHKPDPEPMLLALKNLGDIQPTAAIAVGDAPADVISARHAGIFSVAASWGCGDENSLREAKPDALVRSLIELERLLTEKLGLN